MRMKRIGQALIYKLCNEWTGMQVAGKKGEEGDGRFFLLPIVSLGK